MLLPSAFTGRHETGSTACRTRQTKRLLAADDRTVVTDPGAIQRLLALGAEPFYVQSGAMFATKGRRVFAAPRWLVTLVDLLGARQQRWRSGMGDQEIAELLESDDELRMAFVAAADLAWEASRTREAARSAARQFLEGELKRRRKG